MKKMDTAEALEWRHFPHIVSQEAGGNRRWDLHITNDSLPDDRTHWHAAYAFSRPGAIDAAGRVTAIGRAAIVEGLRDQMHPTDERCVVWGPRECTYVTRHGTIDSDDPPFGQPRDTAAVTRLTALAYEGAALRLPAGCRASHLFLRRLAHDRVEIATAAPMELYDRQEPVRPGEKDPLAGCTDADGRFTLPRRFMGVEVAGEQDGVLLGPVQPDGKEFRVTTAWPTRVAVACIALAGKPLDAALVQTAWDVVERLPCPPIVCGVRIAAQRPCNGCRPDSCHCKPRRHREPSSPSLNPSSESCRPMSTAGFDPATLDWSRHRLAAAEAELGEGVLLADLARMLGPALFEAWDDCIADDLIPDPLPGTSILDPDKAFDDAGDAVAAIHEAFGPAVRRVVSPAKWRDIELMLTDEAAWLAAHPADPDGGPPVPSGTLRMLRGADIDEPITQDNWQLAWEIAELERGFRTSSAMKMTEVATAIAELAIGGSIRLAARPLAGGRCDVEVPTSIWMSGSEQRLRRVASCGFDPARPEDATTEATHLIFAAEDGLAEAIARHCPPHDYVVIPENEEGHRLGSRYPELEERVETFLTVMLAQHGQSNWRLSDLEALVEARFGGDHMRGIVRKVKRRLTTDASLDYLSRPGQPPKEGRPSLMSHADVMRMVGRPGAGPAAWDRPS